MFREIVKQDVYQIRRFPPDRFATVIDVGAFLGVGCMYARFLFPEARIIAIEPHVTDELLFNIEKLNIELHDYAIGDGSVLRQHRGGKKRQFLTDQEVADHGYETKGTAESHPFRDLWVDIELPVLLKMDCEGAERFIFTEDNIDLLNRCDYIGAEIHGSDTTKTRFPPREYYENIFAKLSHRFIKYNRGRRKEHCLVWILR